MTLFSLTAIGGPWAKRLTRRRAGMDDLPWASLRAELGPEAQEGARWLWTQSAFSELASAAAFASIATHLLAAGAPIDLVAAAGDFVADEMVHAELSARVAMALGGAVALDVDLTRLVRPPAEGRPLLRAAELVVRTSCVGEALTVPVLAASRRSTPVPLLRAVLGRILRDETEHAALGPWFLDWADGELRDAERAHLGRIATASVQAFAPLREASCASSAGLDCARYEATFARAVRDRVVRPLAARGIPVMASAGTSP